MTALSESCATSVVLETPPSANSALGREENPEAPCDEVNEMEKRVRATGTHLYSRQHREMYDFPLLHWCTGRRVLEVGAGYGYGLSRVAEVAAEVVAIDVLEKNLKHCASHYALPNVRLELADICAWEAPESSFDVALLIDVIEHIGNDVQALRNVHRLLRPRGVLFVSTVWPRLADDGRPFNTCHCREYFPREFHKMICGVFPHVVLHACPERNLMAIAQKRW